MSVRFINLPVDGSEEQVEITIDDSSLNPGSLRSPGDCFVQAIQRVTNKSWDEVFSGLYKIAFENKCTINHPVVLADYLHDFGSMIRIPANCYYTPAYLIAKNSGSYIIGVPGHCYAVVNHVIYDSSFRTVDDLMDEDCLYVFVEKNATFKF